MKNDMLTKIYRFNFSPQIRFILCQRQCLYLNVDTDADAIANIEITLLLLLMYFKLTNVHTTSNYLRKINGNYWKINVHYSQLPKNV